MFRSIAKASSSRHVLGSLRTAVVTSGTARANAPKVPRDEAIQDLVEGGMVQLVDPTTSKLLPFQPLSAVLASINRTFSFVELVQPKTGIVKIINFKDRVEAGMQQKKKLQAKLKVEQKEVQMTWGVADGDVDHKLSKARAELGKGNRVDLVFAPKKRQALPSPQEMAVLAHQCVEKLQDVAKEWKEKRVQGVSTTVYLQGFPPAMVEKLAEKPTKPMKVSKYSEKLAKRSQG